MFFEDNKEARIEHFEWWLILISTTLEKLYKNTAFRLIDYDLLLPGSLKLKEVIRKALKNSEMFIQTT